MEMLKKCSNRVERPSSICNATTKLRKFSVNLKTEKLPKGIGSKEITQTETQREKQGEKIQCPRAIGQYQTI